MKVYMNGYPNHWIGPDTVIDYVFFWTAWSRCSRDPGIVEDENWVDRPAWADRWADRIEPACGWLSRVRRILNPEIRWVKIDRYDTWSMDSTLAHIIHPMLVQLKATKHGAPHTDDDDVPEELRSTSAEPRENEWDIDSHHFARWDWILDEIIWAFAQQLQDDDESEFFDHSNSHELGGDFNQRLANIKVDHAGLTAHQARKANGFRLFGKYYQNLWD